MSYQPIERLPGYLGFYFRIRIFSSFGMLHPFIGAYCQFARHLFGAICVIGLMREFRRVHADDDQALSGMAFMPLLHMGHDAAAVGAAEGPELHVPRFAPGTCCAARHVRA